MPDAPVAKPFVRAIAYTSMVVSMLLAGVTTIALTWRAWPSENARRLASFLAPLPLALGIEFLLVPSGILVGWLEGAALVTGTVAFAVSVVGLPWFAFSFPAPIDDQLLGVGLAKHRHLRSRSLRWLARSSSFDNGTHRELRTLERWLEHGYVLLATLLVFAMGRLGGVVFPVALVTGIGFSLIYTWVVLDIQRQGDEGGRVQILLGGVWLSMLSWALIGTVLFALGPLIGGLGWSAYIAGLLGVGPFISLIILVGSCGISVLYQGAVDPRAGIRRASLAAGVAIAVLFGFGVVETALTETLFERLGLPEGSGALVAGGVMAVLFKPIHEWIERHMPDWLHPERVA